MSQNLNKYLLISFLGSRKGQAILGVYATSTTQADQILAKEWGRVVGQSGWQKVDMDMLRIQKKLLTQAK